MGEQASSSNNFKTIIIEIIGIIGITVIVVVALNYFGVINLGVLFSSPTIKTEEKKVGVPQNNLEKAEGKANGSPVSSMSILSRNKALHYSHHVIEYEGVIKTIDTDGGIDRASKKSYQVQMFVTVGTGSAATVQLYSKDSIGNVKVINSTGKEIKLNDMKIGDLITVKNTTDSLKQYPNNLVEAVITKK